METFKEIVDRIQEIALKIAPDYPGVTTCDTWEQLYAIESSYEGEVLANEDCHKMIRYLKNRLVMSDEEYLSVAEELRTGKLANPNMSTNSGE